jgi:hypothetical protein
MANTLMRLVGAIVRFCIIIIGGVVIILTFWLGIAFIVVWLILPALFPLSFVYGVATIGA